MSQSIKSKSKLKLKPKPPQRQQNYQIYDDGVISEVGSRIYKSFLKRHSNNPNILFRSLDLKNNFQKSQLSDYDKKKMIKQMLNRSIDQRINYLSIADEYFVTNQSKPSIFNLQFSNQHPNPRRASKVKFNSTHRKLILNKKLGSTFKLNSKMPKQQKIQTSEENPEVQRVKNNRFPPRVTRLDYTKPNTQILNKYLRKFQSPKKYESQNQNNSQFPPLSEITHLEQLEKFKTYLLQFQSEQKYHVLPKMSINSVDHDKSEEKAPYINRNPLKQKLINIKRQQKQIFEPWEDKGTEQQYSRALETPQKFI